MALGRPPLPGSHKRAKAFLALRKRGVSTAQIAATYGFTRQWVGRIIKRARIEAAGSKLSKQTGGAD